MKDLRSSELRRYRVPVPKETEIGLTTFFKGSKAYCFEIPTTKEEYLKVIISEINNNGKTNTRMSITVIDNYGRTMRATMLEEVYKAREILQEPKESIVWQYNPMIETLRSVGFKKITGNNFDMNNFVLQMHQYDGELPPFEEAYNKKMQKNKGLFYSRGTIGEWKFIHILIKDVFPWAVIQKIADKEFKNNLVQIFFNAKTKEHPNEFIIWYNPKAKHLV